MKKLSLLTFIIFISVNAQIQTDTLDLSEYPVKFELNKKIRETSGVEFYNNSLYTFNDSGNKPEIYKLNSENGQIIQTIKVQNVKNRDWEEITRKGDTLFIGDFGNNRGTRKNLTIYSIILPKNNTNHIIKTEALNKLIFNYEDQTDFSPKNYKNNNFDCEALIYYNGNLHLFSKRWGDYHTAHYIISPDKKSQTVKNLEMFNTECVITGADIYNDELYMTGYTREGLAYIWKFSNFKDGYFFNGKAKRFFIGLTASIGQIEGIAVTKDKIYITGEEMNYSLFHAKPSLYIIDKKEL